MTRVDGAISVTPAPPYLVEYLQYHHRGFKLVHYRRVNDFELRKLHQIQPDGSLITFPGFCHKIRELCFANGDVVVEHDHRTALPPLDWAAINAINWASIGSTGLRDYQFEPIAEFLVKAQNDSGIVCAAAGYGKSLIQAITYAAFHSLNTILAIPLKEVFFQTYEKFVQLFPDKHIGRVGGGFHDLSSEITITTFKSLPSCAIEKCQLLLIDELQSVGGTEMTTQVLKMAPIRVFGYTATDKGMFNQTEKLIKGIFGERLIFIPYQEAEAVNAVVPVTVWMLHMPDDLMVNASSIEGKFLQGIKNCQIRNRLIGMAAAAVPDNWQTIVFVDHIADHLVSLHKEMPVGTRFIHRGASIAKLGKSYALSTKQQKEIIAAFKANQFKYLIATDSFRAGVDIPNCRVVIQGSGGTSEVELIQEAGRGSRVLSESMMEELEVAPKTHQVLIDFIDNHDVTLEAMSRKRMAIYQKQGWTVREITAPNQIDWSFYKPS